MTNTFKSVSHIIWRNVISFLGFLFARTLYTCYSSVFPIVYKAFCETSGISGQPLLSGQLAHSWGCPLNRGLTVEGLYISDSPTSLYRNRPWRPDAMLCVCDSSPSCVMKCFSIVLFDYLVQKTTSYLLIIENNIKSIRNFRVVRVPTHLSLHISVSEKSQGHPTRI